MNESSVSWMFDCGEGTQQQILITPLKLSKLEKIYITHLHGDHIFGLPGVLGSRSFQGGTTPLTIFGPIGIKEFIETNLILSQTRLQYDLHIEEIKEGIIFEDDSYLVKAYLLDHVIPSYGYRVEEKDRPGALQVNRLVEKGIKPGPIYKELKEGKQVVLKTGEIINGIDFLHPATPGRVIAIAGDTRRCKASLELAANADLLIHEATFRKDKQKLAEEFGHATTVDAASIAKKANCKNLIITHISARYNEEGKEMEEEAQAIFAETILANDFFVFSLPGKHKKKEKDKNKSS